MIVSRREAFAVCPSYLDYVPWFFVKLPGVPDEGVALDNALASHATDTARHRIDSARAARARLIALLDTLADRFPADSFLVGQRVRFLVDQAMSDQAVAAAQRCQASRAWCASLAGYALASSGRAAEADSAFDAAQSAMSPEAQCSYAQTVRQVLDAPARQAFDAMDCAQRVAFVERVFWLADPLLGIAGNERRVEHHARVTLVALRSALDQDERQPWRAAAGADARETLILRYGWPTYVYWNGPDTDANHYTYLIERGTDASDPYTTYEYSPGRYHMIPGAHALAAPFMALPDDWEIVSRERGTRSPAVWWPVEHFASPYPLAQLEEFQLAVLRRQDDVLVATALRLDAGLLKRFPNQRIDSIAMLASVAPAHARIVATGSGVTDAIAVLHGRVASQPIVLGIEGVPEFGRNAPIPWIRFGLAPPAPLSALGPGEIAISGPVLLHATGGASAPALDPEAALTNMLASEQLTDRSIAVYWETYGLRVTDSVELALSVEAASTAGFLVRLGRLLRLTGPSAPVTVSWTEPGGGREAAQIDGPVPIVARRINLDLSDVRDGEYVLTIGVRRIGGSWVENHRRIVVR